MMTKMDPTSQDGRDVFAIYTGEVPLEIRGTGSDWSYVKATIRIPTAGQHWIPDQLGGAGTVFRGGVASVNLTCVANERVANDAGWGVDSVSLGLDTSLSQNTLATSAEGHGTVLDELSALAVYARFSVRDSDGLVLRAAYQVTVAGQTYHPVLEPAKPRPGWDQAGPLQAGNPAKPG